MDRHSLWIKNDSTKRKALLKFELKKTVTKALKLNKYSPLHLRYSAFFKANKVNKQSSMSFTKNRCVISGRTYSIDKSTQVSRYIFRKKAYDTLLPGFKRASW